LIHLSPALSGGEGDKTYAMNIIAILIVKNPSPSGRGGRGL
jgi:hypothetical protein